VLNVTDRLISVFRLRWCGPLCWPSCIEDMAGNTSKYTLYNLYCAQHGFISVGT
jgi:hypothetical protein